MVRLAEAAVAPGPPGNAEGDVAAHAAQRTTQQLCGVQQQQQQQQQHLTMSDLPLQSREQQQQLEQLQYTSSEAQQSTQTQRQLQPQHQHQCQHQDQQQQQQQQACQPVSAGLRMSAVPDRQLLQLSLQQWLWCVRGKALLVRVFAAAEAAWQARTRLEAAAQQAAGEDWRVEGI